LRKYKVAGWQNRPAIVVGVTGHRVLIGEKKVRQGIDRALNQIRAHFPDQRMVCLSSLAEGADRMVAEMVLQQPDRELFAVLPLPEGKYIRDFASDASKREFDTLLKKARQVKVLPPARTRKLAYLSAGTYILDQCDILLAVWDGFETKGQGGTGEVVNLARKSRKPLAWIHAGICIEGPHQPTSLNQEQVNVSFDNFPDG